MKNNFRMLYGINPPPMNEPKFPANETSIEDRLARLEKIVERLEIIVDRIKEIDSLRSLGGH